MLYRKRPVTVEAVVFDETSEITELLIALGLDPVRIDYSKDPPVLIIETLEGAMQANPGDYVIKGVKGEIYPCKPDIFKQTYDAVTGDEADEEQPQRSDLTFGQAIEAAKRGAKIARVGWNGKAQHVELATCISFTAPDGTVVNPEHDAIGNKALAFCGTSGVQMGWLASQADMLADDWLIV